MIRYMVYTVASQKISVVMRPDFIRSRDNLFVACQPIKFLLLPDFILTSGLASILSKCVTPSSVPEKLEDRGMSCTKDHLLASERSLLAIVTFPRKNWNGIEMEPGNPIT
ncbi:unnamed protein product [Larinioides sclopetarius]|uniref:Uncharacterized protein n=1 Tax=Larinioides sclopetarius TaxID=280406 RepID=A0AAV2AX84_9ARAC